MSTTYVIPDIHGRFDLLVRAMASIYSRQAANAPFKIVTLGDYIDRGPQSRDVIQLLMDSQAKGRPIICLKGNHEDVMVETLTTPLDPSWWMSNGGSKTMYSYGHPKTKMHHSGAFLPFHSHVIPAEHIAWLSSLPTMHVDTHRVYVHAGVDATKALDEQNADMLLWMLYPDFADIGHGDRHVVHGHHSFKDGPVLLKNRTNLDTFAYATGVLTVGVFDDDTPGGPTEVIDVIGEEG